jgi:hypothetical protein
MLLKMTRSAVIGFANIARKVLILRQSRCLSAFELAIAHQTQQIFAYKTWYFSGQAELAGAFSDCRV